MVVDAEPLRLRRGIELIPSWIPGRPGVVLRDPFRYAEGPRLIPSAFVPLLSVLDGTRSRAEIIRSAGRFGGASVEPFITSLTDDGYIDGERFRERKDACHAEFVRARLREALHAGSGYPDRPDELRVVLDGYRGTVAADATASASFGIAAPHVSPFGAPLSYGAAYHQLGPHLADRTFVVLGTSHYGAPDRFGLTTKPFRTPLGEAPVDVAAVEALAAAAPRSVVREDYAHSIEHSIEFQVVFLQHAVAPDVRIIPILCGPLECAGGDRPESVPEVAEFFAALGQLQSKRDDLFWILGIDLAHVGERYGHAFAAQAQAGVMRDVGNTDLSRLERVCEGDADGFLELAHPRDDALNWCGTSPLYTFLRTVPSARGEILRYDQWNIDARSVVTFAGLGFDTP